MNVLFLQTAAARAVALGLMLGAVLAANVQAAPVAEADLRAAVAVAQPERAVLQAVTRAGARLVAVGERGLALYSDDQGKSWQQARVPVSVTLTAVHFASASQGWAVGHFGTVLHSADGGKSWQRQLDGKRAAALALAEVEARAKVAPAGDAGVAKALANAQRLVADGPDKPFLDVHFFDARRGLIVGAYGLIFATSDGGQHWQSLAAQLDNPQAHHLYSIAVGGNAVYLAGEQGLAFRSTLGGGPFQRLSTPYQGSYFTAQADEHGNVLLAGLRGNVYRSADQGASWQQLTLPAPVSVVASSRSSKGMLLLANQAGQLLASSDMGQTIRPLATPPLPPLTGVLQLDDGQLIVTSLRGVLRP
ncbi:WD40/YVTN/BNR-like repeat-containing protein [Vogesella facilis]|uniref:WD40/YVTN/BNR-like repeat-containing protein n=1 Tax=Vogesella facilis TaxID=1655232 RepID=A0ABV7RFX3_9NEIS